MKKNSTKALAQQGEVTEYKKKRQETMRKNAEIMKAKGCGALADTLFQANPNIFLERYQDEGYGDYDEEYIPEDEVHNDAIVPFTKSKRKAPSSKRKSMSDFLPPPLDQHPVQKQQQSQQQTVDQQQPTLLHQNFKQQQMQVVNQGPNHHQYAQLQQQIQQKKTKFCSPGTVYLS